MKDYIYKGLTGSKLWGYEGSYSDTDYVCISKGFDDSLVSKDHQDFFYIKPMDFIEYVFELRPDDLHIFHRALQIPGWVFSTPTEKDNFSDFLLSNREKIVESNKQYWYNIATVKAKTIIENYNTTEGDPLMFTLHPKNLLQCWVTLRPALNYPKGMTFKEAMTLSDEERIFVEKVRKSKVSNLELFDKIAMDYEEANRNKDFWSVPQDFVIHNQLKMEAYSYFQ